MIPNTILQTNFKTIQTIVFVNLCMKAITTLLNFKFPAIFWTILIFVLCTIPSEHIPQGEKMNDKANHFIAFAGFTFFWLFHYAQAWKIILIGILYGIAIEFWQGILPEDFHRSFDWYDTVADGIGGIIGYFIWLIFSKLIPKK